jgi:Xaa-Pro aminopeptidase
MTEQVDLTTHRNRGRIPAPGAPSAPRPFLADDFARRIERATGQAAQSGLSGLIIAPGPDLSYLSGYTPTAVLERPTLLFLGAGKEPSMVVPLLELPDAKEASGASLLNFVTYVDGENPYTKAARLLEPGGRYGISDSCWAMHVLGLQREVPESRFEPLTEAMSMLRGVKDDDELERLASAGASADACYPEICKVRFAGRSENEVAHDLADLLIAHGHSRVDFTIVASGPNGANPHHLASDRIINEGDMVVLDYGGIMDGYGSDTTRTVHVGEATSEERRVHEIVVRAQQVAFDAVRPGVTCQEIDRAGRRVIAEEGYGDYFIHRIGHGIGLTTHEPPYMVEGETKEIVPGMCFSIEPGIYLPGRFGVRIEDIVVATEQGGRRLNTNPHEMQIVA